MGIYTRTGPFANGGAPGISATFLNNVESVFLRQSGDTEVGKYFFQGGSWGTSVSTANWVGFTSRTVPLSVSIDTSIALAGYATPTSGTVYSSGFSVNAVSSGVSTTARFGGSWTANY